jgi:hypothetical protein
MTGCPLCGHSIRSLSVRDVITTIELTEHEEHVLETVWQGKGLPVPTERLFDAMWSNDPAGGLHPTRMYAHLHKAMNGLEKKLEGTGISIKSAGRHKGLRLQLTSAKAG